MNSLSYGIIVLHYDSFWVLTTIGDSSPPSNPPRKKGIRMLYVDSVIIFSLFFELQWKYNLLVHYKLNIFRPLLVNYFDIHALLSGSYARFIPLDKMVFYGYWKYLSSVRFLMLHIDLTFFPLCSEICCSLFNYPLGIILIMFTATCVSIIALVHEKNMTFLAPNC